MLCPLDYLLTQGTNKTQCAQVNQCVSKGLKRKRTCWKISDTKALYRHLRSKSLILFLKDETFKISCQRAFCDDCEKWHKKANWGEYETRLISWEK